MHKWIESLLGVPAGPFVLLNDGLSSQQTYKNIMLNATGHIRKHAAKYLQNRQIRQCESSACR